MDNSIKVPAYFANFVLMDYGLGRIWLSCTWSKRFRFRKNNLNITPVVTEVNNNNLKFKMLHILVQVYPSLNGLKCPEESIVKILNILKNNLGQKLILD